MTEHKDITGQEIIAIDEAFNGGGFSLDSIEAVNAHFESDHRDLADRSIVLLIERARHLAAILKGEVIPNNLKPSQK
ncbi:hypothetical protein HYZ70_03760 [Candidatus Curtissbacteria bacterium]|nr:hypothetical protein [Candidatus Curtissbacteria bacterium]